MSEPSYLILPRKAMEVDNSTASAGMESKSAARSCTTCSKAKAKCVRRSGGESCERCYRLRKECHLREPVARRRKATKTTRAAQLEALENKIEHLVNALATSQSQRGYNTEHGQSSPSISQLSDKTASLANMPHEAQNARQAEVLNTLCHDIDMTEESTDQSSRSGSNNTPVNSTVPPCNNQQPAVPALTYADYHGLGVSMSEAEILLDRYRRLMAHSMPFVLLSANSTAQQLSVDHPVLLHAICIVTYFHDIHKQQELVKKLMRNISERILINNEKSLDIVQGILVFVGWFHPHIFFVPQMTNLLHLAMAMIADLGFDRPPQQCGDFKTATTKAVHGPSLVTRVPTLEEHRALMGTFYLTSMLSSSFKKIDAMDWTNYMTEVLNVIEQSAECDSDLFLIQIVRLQRLIEETCNTQVPQAPMSMYVKAFSVELERLRKEDPNKDQNNNIFLRVQYLTCEILIWELSLNDLQENKATPLRSHIDHLFHLVEAIKKFLDVYFLFPVAQYLTMPFPIFGQFAHAFITLIKVASLEIDGWEMRALDDRLNFIKTIDEAAERFEASTKSEPDGLRVNNDIFSKWAQRVRWMKQVYETKFMQGNERTEDRAEAARNSLRSPVGVECPQVQQQQQQQPTPPDDVLSGDFFNYLDDNFWQSFAGDFDLGFPVEQL